jgi:hypothetical protein
MRVRFALILGLAVGVLATVGSATSAPPGKRLGHNVRWDLALPVIPPGELVAGGSDFGRDAATGDRIELTGSGHTKPATGDSTGGGTFVHRTSGGTEVAHGVYVVTGFVSWYKARGTFPLPIDGIGHAADASAGQLFLNVHLIPTTGQPEIDGVLGIHCHFGDTPDPIEEGFTLDVGPFHFTQDGGVTVFHIL